MSRKLRSSLVILSILVAALAMWLWLRSFNVSTDEVAQLFARVQWWLLLPLFVLLVGHVALSAWRWSLIEVGLGGQLPRFGPAFVTGAFAQGLGTMLPSPIVNVICRGLANRLNGASGLRGAFSGGIDQIADLVIVLLLVIPAAFAFIHRDFWLYLWGGGTMLLIGLALLAYLPNLTRSLSLPFRIPGIHLALPLVHRPTPIQNLRHFAAPHYQSHPDEHRHLLCRGLVFGASNFGCSATGHTSNIGVNAARCYWNL